MIAGKELDALISDEIFSKPFRKPTHGPCCTCQVCGYANDWDCQCGFSESNSRAWEIVDKLDERDFILMLDSMRHSPLLGKWRATFVNKDFSDYWEDAGWTEYGDTPSLAICLAALKLVNSIKARQ